MKNISQLNIVYFIQTFVRDKLQRQRWYSQTHKHIEGITITGSVTHGFADRYSDIDLHVFMPLKYEECYTKSEYIYIYHQHHINVIIRSSERLRRLAKSQDDTEQGWILGHDILVYEKHRGRLSSLLKKASVWPERKWKNLIQTLENEHSILYINFLKAKKRGLTVGMQLITRKLQELQYRLLFARKRKHFPTLHWLDKELTMLR